MTSAASDDKADEGLQESYLNDRCAYLTEELARHNAQVNSAQVNNAQVSVRTRSASDGQRIKHRQTSLDVRQRHASAQV